MTRNANTIGWKKGIYPSDDFLTEGIRRGELYVLDGEKEYAACVVLNGEYNEGYIGCPWKTDCNPAELPVPHALAVNPDVQGKGIGKRNAYTQKWDSDMSYPKRCFMD